MSTWDWISWGLGIGGFLAIAMLALAFGEWGETDDEEQDE